MGEVAEIRVFLASPGDLQQERIALRGLEARINSMFSASGLRVRVSGWEEIGPGYGRPQALINPLVDECHIFIGFLRRRWGSSTGEHDSGFAEEFERALARRQASEAEPQIAIYFADLSQGELDDPGPELRKVVKFRRRLENQHLAMYATFASAEDLGTQVGDLLQRHLLEVVLSQGRRDLPAGTSLEHEVGGLESATQQIEEASGEEVGSDAKNQLGVALAVLRELLDGRVPEQSLDRDRLELLGVALSKDSALLGAHLANRLYRRRADLDLIVAEHAAWVRTLLSDVGQARAKADRVIPGWAVISADSDDFARELVGYASEGGTVGLGALRTMLRLQIRPTVLWPLEVGNRATETSAAGTDDEYRVDRWVSLLNALPGRGEVMDYLFQDLSGHERDAITKLDGFAAAILEKSDLNADSRKVLEAARESFAGDPNSLVGVLGYSADSKALWQSALGQIEKLEPERLNRLAAQSFNSLAKELSVEQGLRSDSLSSATLKALLFDEDEPVLGLLLMHAESNSEFAARCLEVLRNGSDGKAKPSGLEGRLLALTASAPSASEVSAKESPVNVPWEALTWLAPEEMIGPAREMLKTDGADLRAQLAKAWGDEPDAIDYVVDDRKRAAAALLARFHDRTDNDAKAVLEWFEGHAARGYVLDFAWRILESVVPSVQNAELVAALESHQGAIGMMAASNFVDGPLGPAIYDVVASEQEGSYLLNASLRWYVTQPERTLEELKFALYHPSEEVRMTAVQQITATVPRDDLVTILEDYPKATTTFWYNVIAALDEAVFAPTPGR
jgi:hypothetical protein